ncbi:MAG: 30S ribosomal protein S12 methylthiotransferase RimO [Candidatus Omnitrophica bacterium]|nr:30S ribosomal protein S12 methylthiotransferase RimO [Candidatus Omnitrophota bacterium]
MKVALINLGCSKNLVDGEIMLGFLHRSGFAIKENPSGCDVAIVNTCAFIKDAKEEAIDTVFNLVDLKKKGKLKKIIVSGCLPQRYGRELASLLDEVDGFLGPGNIDKISATIAKLFKQRQVINIGRNHYLYNHNTPRIYLTPEHYAYVKIADGCDNRCSYCVIPQIRGTFRSRRMESIVNEARDMADRGIKEINLISQDTTFYGYDIYKKYALDQLLKKLVKIKKLQWIRLLYSHPRHLNVSLLKLIRDEPKICKYIDLPIQHINDRILKLMKRKVNAVKIKKLIADIRRIIPDAALRTTMIVGFPQETELEFKELYEYAADVKFERLGVFTYSAEENTPAALLKGQIPQHIKNKRRNKIMLMQQKIVERNNSAFVGRKMEVLIDQVLNRGLASGRTQYDAPDVDGLVYVKGKDFKVGSMETVMITDNVLYDLTGEKV